MSTGRLNGMALDPLTLQYRKYYLVSFWVETLIYGGYVFLFGIAMNVLRRKDEIKSFSFRFQNACHIIMFFLISIHNCTNVFRMIHAYAEVPLTDRSPAAPVNYIRKCSNWDCYMFMVISALLTWTGEILLIYRCFLVWQRSRRIVILPCILFLISVGTTIFGLYWFQHPFDIPYPKAQYALGMPFPIGLAQGVLTTGLIAYRIWKQHRQTVRAGAYLQSNGGALSLLAVFRILVESAMIWTSEVLITTILFYLRHPAVVIVQHATIPSIGIVFSLITVRAHVAREEAARVVTPSYVRSHPRTLTAPSFTPASWLDHGSSEDCERTR